MTARAWKPKSRPSPTSPRRSSSAPERAARTSRRRSPAPAPSSPPRCGSASPSWSRRRRTAASGMRVIKDKRVALTSTSDLTPRGIERFLADALELVEISQEDPFAGPADPALLVHEAAARSRSLRPRRRRGDRGRGDRAGQARRAGGARLRSAHQQQRRRHLLAHGRRLRAGAVERLPRRLRGLVLLARWSAPSPRTRAARSAAASTTPPSATCAELDSPEEVGREAARRTLRKLGAKKVPTCEAAVVFDPDAARAILGLMAGCVMGELHLAQVELPRRPRGHARRERSR